MSRNPLFCAIDEGSKRGLNLRASTPPRIFYKWRPTSSSCQSSSIGRHASPLPLSLALRLPSINENMKFIVAVLLLALAAYVSADCKDLERVKVKLQWARAFGKAHNRVLFGLKLWHSIIHDHPEIKDVFKNVRGDNLYSDEFSAHSQRVLSGLDMTISMLDTPDVLEAQLVHLKGQHTERNLKPEYYTFFLNHLLEVIGEDLGTDFDQGAWHDCIDHIINGIK